MTIWLVSLMVMAISLPLEAQFLEFATPGIPRLANGKPDLAAPAPRTSEGKPDLSGVWRMPPTGCSIEQVGPGSCPDFTGGTEFGDIAAHLNNDLPYKPWAAELVKKRSEGLGKDDPVALCQPAGAMRLHTYPPYRKIVQNPGLILILSERDVTFRQIFIDGRPLPKDPNPSFNGYSTAMWEGDTLIVKTIGFRDDIWLDRKGNPLTDAATMTERFRRLDVGHLEIEITIDDPKAYTKPWTIKLRQLLVPDTDLLEYFCQENEKDAPHVIGK